MKPLEDHTTEELTDLLHEHCAAWSASWFVPEVVAEIRRRERERCAQIADEEADQSRRHGKQGFPNEADLVAEYIAERIRQLQ